MEKIIKSENSIILICNLFYDKVDFEIAIMDYLIPQEIADQEGVEWKQHLSYPISTPSEKRMFNEKYIFNYQIENFNYLDFIVKNIIKKRNSLEPQWTIVYNAPSDSLYFHHPFITVKLHGEFLNMINTIGELETSRRGHTQFKITEKDYEVIVNKFLELNEKINN